MQYLKLIMLQVSDKLKACLNYASKRERAQSTFIKFEEMDAAAQAQAAQQMVSE